LETACKKDGETTINYEHIMTSKPRGREVHEWNAETKKDTIFRPAQTLSLSNLKAVR
jgi:hypothetical protein